MIKQTLYILSLTSFCAIQALTYLISNHFILITLLLYDFKGRKLVFSVPSKCHSSSSEFHVNVTVLDIVQTPANYPFPEHLFFFCCAMSCIKIILLKNNRSVLPENASVEIFLT